MSSELNGNENENTEGSELDPGLFPGLEDVPQEYRQHLDPILSEVNKNAGRKINEYSEKVKAWEPYEELGVNQLEPETVGQLMGLLEMMGKAEEDPTELKQWYDELGQHFNLNAESESEEDDFGLDEENENMSQEDLAQLIAQTVQEQMQPFTQQQESRTEEEAVAEADGVLEEELSQIGDEWKVEVTPEMEEAICTFALKHEGEGAVLKGAQEYRDLIEGAEGNLFEQKTNQPSVPEKAGVPNTQPEAIKSFADAKQAVEHALEQSVNS